LKTKTVLVVADRSAQTCRSERTEISEYDHGLEKARLSGTIGSEYRVRRFAKAEHLA